MKALKYYYFDVRGRPELSAAIQKRLFNLGFRWLYCAKAQKASEATYLYANPTRRVLSYTTLLIDTPTIVKLWNGSAGWTRGTLSDLYDIEPETHTISFDDGDPAEISHKSFMALKDALK